MNEYLEKLSAERCTELEIHNTIDVAEVFSREDALNAKTLYLTRFGRIPNWIHLDDIDCKKAHDWFLKSYQDKIVDCSYTKRRAKRKEIFFDDVYYFLFDDLLIYLNENQSEVKFLYRKTDTALVNTIVDKVSKFKEKKIREKPEIKLLVSSQYGLSTKSMEISKPKFSIEDNYNDDFLAIHQTIISRLRKKKDKGLILLHGKPGTGKTSYIRYLVASTKKQVIFLPPNMAASITDPGLMNVLMENPDSIFIIEDAENIIIDRNRSGSSSVSALLNLADGLLSDCLNIQIICSFNTDLSRVDSALMRKGRLIAKYEFAELEASKAQALSNKLGFSSEITAPMTLAAVYNQNDSEYMVTSQRPRIGFNVAV
jgi:hypothetical protein